MIYIAEKPKTAEKIAKALGIINKEKPKKINTLGTFKVGKDIVVSAAGHLFSLHTKEKGYPVLNPYWTALNNIGKKYAKAYIENIRRFLKREIAIATDYDMEGTLIGYNIVRFLSKNTETIARIKFSSLTANELIEAIKNPQQMDYHNAYAGEARHYIDWLYGINLSRALTNAARKAGLKTTLSIGRVQGPTLSFIYKREKEIETFTPTFYGEISFNIFKATIKPYEKAKEIVKRMKNIAVVKEITIKEKKLQPPPPFNLSSLQQEAYRHLKIQPSKTLYIAQSLYEKGLISYPRTESEKLPPLDGKKIIMSIGLKKYSTYIPLMVRRKPVEGKKTDEAHPAIYPTGEKPKDITKEEFMIYDLIVRRFISCFMENALIEEIKITIENVIDLNWEGKEVKREGFLSSYYFLKPKEKTIKLPKKGDKITGKPSLKKKKTKPPARYSTASLIKTLENKKLGTKTTRALIIETLFNRNYIKNKTSIKITSLGKAVFEAMEKHVPSIVDENLTRELENKIELIKKKRKTKEDVIKEAQEIVKNTCEEFKEKELTIAKELSRKLKIYG